MFCNQLMRGDEGCGVCNTHGQRCLHWVSSRQPRCRILSMCSYLRHSINQICCCLFVQSYGPGDPNLRQAVAADVPFYSSIIGTGVLWA